MNQQRYCSVVKFISFLAGFRRSEQRSTSLGEYILKGRRTALSPCFYLVQGRRESDHGCAMGTTAGGEPIWESFHETAGTALFGFAARFRIACCKQTTDKDTDTYLTKRCLLSWSLGFLLQTKMMMMIVQQTTAVQPVNPQPAYLFTA